MAEKLSLYDWARVTPREANEALWLAHTGRALDAAHDDVLEYSRCWDEAWDALLVATAPVGALPSGSWTMCMHAAHTEKVSAYMALSDEELMAVLALMRHDRPFEFWIATCALILKQAEGAKHEAP